MPALILIVDDDEAICRTLSVALQVRGYDVLCAADGRMAEQLVDARQPDLDPDRYRDGRIRRAGADQQLCCGSAS